MVDIERLNLSTQQIGRIGRPVALYLIACVVMPALALVAWAFWLGGADQLMGVLGEVGGPPASAQSSPADGSVSAVQ